MAWNQKAGSHWWRFVPHPSWPTPPVGWTPPHGWQPDPSWPTPPGWRWTRRRRAPVIGLAAIVFAVTGLVALSAAVSARGGSLDPTDPANYNFYELVNDRPSTVYLHLCANVACTQLDGHFDWIPVLPGGYETEQVYWGPTTPTSYLVSATAGLQIAGRCLLIDASRKSTVTTRLVLSGAVRCG